MNESILVSRYRIIKTVSDYLSNDIFQVECSFRSFPFDIIKRKKCGFQIKYVDPLMK